MSDQIQRFLFERTNVRGEIVTLERAYGEVLDRHGYPPAVNRLLGELLVELSLAPNYMRHRMQVLLATELYPKRLPGDEPEPLVVETHALEELPALLMRDDFHEARAIAALFIARDTLRQRRYDEPRLGW